jgi:hypothetical protein
MFDSREISAKAQLRAEEIKAQKKIRQQQLKFAAAMIGVGAVASAVIVTNTSVISKLAPLIDYSASEQYIITMDDNQIPLAGFQFHDDQYKPGSDFTMPEYDSVTFSADTDRVSLLLFNSEENTCYLTFEIALTDTGESLYMSDMAAPSTCIEEITLARPLAKGNYKAELIIRAYDCENLAETQCTVTELHLIAE